MSVFLQVLSGKRRMELLPGDRDNLAIQTRGGPEKHEVTGWVLVSDTWNCAIPTTNMYLYTSTDTYTHLRVLILHVTIFHAIPYEYWKWTLFSFQISPLTKDEEGSYECHATNSKGEASAVGSIHLVESIDDIIKKGNALTTQPIMSPSCVKHCHLKGPVIWHTTGSCNLKRSSDWWCHFLSVAKEDELWSADRKDNGHRKQLKIFFSSLPLNSDECLVWTLFCLNLVFAVFWI